MMPHMIQLTRADNNLLIWLNIDHIIAVDVWNALGRLRDESYTTIRVTSGQVFQVLETCQEVLEKMGHVD